MEQQCLTYNVLWFDDYFALLNEPNLDPKKKVERNQFEDFINLFSKNGDIKIFSASNTQQYLELLDEPANKYDAIILDLHGLDQSMPASNTPAHNAITKYLTLEPRPLLYIFSAAKGDSSYEYETYTATPEHCFSKTRDGMLSLYEKFIDDISKKNQLYANHEYILELFNNGWIQYGKPKEQIDEIMKNYREESFTYFPNNNIRKVFEKAICPKMVSLGIIPDECETLNQRVQYICKKCEEIAPDVPNNKKPLFPFSLCSQGIKNIIYYLSNLHNTESHERENEMDDTFVRKEILKSTYKAFFVAMKWYHWFMKLYISHKGDLSAWGIKIYKNKSTAPQLETLPLEYDDELDVYHCGDGQVPTGLVQSMGLKIGQMLTIEKKNKNTSENIMITENYPYYLRLKIE